MSNVQDYHKNLWDTFKIEGKWCLPELSDEPYPGILSFTPNYGVELEVEDENKLWDYVKQHRILWGTSTESQRITLFGFPAQEHSLFDAPVALLRKDQTVRFDAPSSSTYHFRDVFLGEHFEKIEDMQLNTLAIKFSYLDEWISAEREAPFAGETDLIHTRPEQRSTGTVKDIASVTVKKDGSIFITAKRNGMSLERYRDSIYYVQNFLSLMLLEPLYPSSVNGTLLATNRALEIFFPQLNTSKPVYGRISPPYVLFTYNEIRNEFDRLVKNLSSLDRVICDLFFSYFYSPLTFI